MTDLTKTIQDSRVEGGIGVWWLGQSGYALKNASGDVILIDPYLTESIGPTSYLMHTRLVPPLLAADTTLDLAGVLFTHDHHDHLDANSATLLALRGERTFYASDACLNKLRTLDVPAAQLQPLEPGSSAQLGAFEVHGVKAVHGGGAVGFVIRAGSLTFYFSGDTSLFLGMRDIGASFDINVAFLNINGQAGNMDPYSALHAVAMTGAAVAVPNHYGMYADNTEDPERFAYAMLRRFPERSCVMLKPGLGWTFREDT